MRPRKKVSQKEIAGVLGISNVSVSNALAGRKGVSENLTRKVRRAAAELGYGAKETAKPQGEGKDPAADDGFHGVQKLIRYLRTKGYENILYVEPDAEGLLSDAGNRTRIDRRLGYRCAMYLEILDPGPKAKAVRPFDLEGDSVILTLRDAKEYLEKQSAGGQAQAGDLRTVFLCSDEDTAGRLAGSLAESGFRVPEDVGVVGYRGGEDGRLL